MVQRFLFSCILLLCVYASQAQTAPRQGDPKLTEYWDPEVKVITPGKTNADPPSDAIILFGGQNADAWAAKDNSAAKWKVADGILTIVPGTGEIHTKQGFGDCQLHIEWRIAADVKGESQARGNSGIFFMGRYELQVLDSYKNRTYSNGQAGSIYKQLPPLVNASRGPGEWQTYDVIFTAPRFNEDGVVKSQAHITVLHNGVLVQNDAHLWGGTQYIGTPTYEKHGDKEPLVLQDHGNTTSFRNIWIRPL
ncbi:protein of unknown function DUF1080 [Niastella koreensis GR20-10]|uniref:3-keto-alpha-glucoside-1,2-lyase/3-keto-2-hydroxy-glucal hydratase domain-containing protein n=1 Tax=Niastella koreensis (strain DSM 17620 / KACC 11465 / NBRC 106392 / GR20-10) TaxID=700598 RepID=G8TJK0_NIAKG|nr:DUF1080 domain-containing protein [Niastella koreensis]AEW00747.1 protein of unknown function DUF1080 [Niastella koreensis GR20-10]